MRTPPCSRNVRELGGGVYARSAVVDGASSGPSGSTSQECEHRCRRSGHVAQASRRPHRGRSARSRCPTGTASDAAPAGKGRPTQVRNRLIVAVAVVAAAIAGAGVPSIAHRLRATARVPGAGDPRGARPRTPHPRPLPRRRARRGHLVHRRRPPEGQGAQRAAQRPRRPAGRGAARRHRRAGLAADRPRRHRSRAPRRADRQGHRAGGAQAYSATIAKLHRLAERTGRADAARVPAPALRARRAGLRRAAGRRRPRPAARRAQRADHAPRP